MASSIIFILVTAWLLLTILLYVFQPKFIYFPHRTLSFTPAAIGLSYEDITFTSSDGLTLHGWHIKHDDPVATLLFFHGNAGNISHRLDSLQIFHRLGLSVFIFDYRGYGQSEGQASEKGTYLDAEAAWNYLIKEQGIDSKKIIIFGRSLGAAIAAWLAEKHTPAALMLESAFSSIVDIAKHYYPYLPIKWMLRIHYPTIDRIKNIDCPLLVIHSPNDEIIPYKFGQRIFTAARQPKTFLEIRGGHNDGFLVTGEKYTEGIANFIKKYSTMDRINTTPRKGEVE